MMTSSNATSTDIWQMIFAGDVQQAVADSRAGRANSAAGVCDALVLEPPLSSKSGHHFGVASTYERLLTKLGYSTLVAHANQHQLELSPCWLPWFMVPHHTLAHGPVTSLRDLEHVESYFEIEFSELISAGDPKVLVSATTRFSNICALAAAAAKQAHPPKLIMGVLEVEEVPDCPHPELPRNAFARAARILDQANIDYQLIVETDSVRWALEAAGFEPQRIRRYQYVAARDILDGPRGPNYREAVTVGYLGGTRPVRSPELAAELACTMSLPHGKWHVQLDLNYIAHKCAPGVVSKFRALAEAGAIIHYDPGLDDERYRSIFRQLDFILMPYTDRYESIGSGVLIEAIYAGVVPIVPRRSTLFDLYSSLTDQLPPSFDKLSVDAVGAAVRQAIERQPQHAEIARLAKQRWQQHPESVEQWEQDLSNWLMR